MKKSFYIVFFTCFILAGYAQQEKIQKLDALFDLLEKHQQDIGAIAIDKAGERIYDRKFGYDSLPAKVRQCENLKNRIGSITKMFTAVMIFQLEEEGRIELTETLNNYFPEVPNADKITISHLLSHTSGLGDVALKEDTVLTWLFEPVTQKELMEEIFRQGVSFEPGEYIRYSNSGYYLLGKILEQKYGKPYEEILEEKILLPVGAVNTVSNVSQDSCIAPSYRWNYGMKKWEEIDDFYFPNVVGFGDVASTTDDMLKIMNGIWGQRFISDASLKAMEPKAGKQFGKGLMSVPFCEKTFYGHSGSTFGSYALLIHNQKDQLTLAITVNGMGWLMNDIVDSVLSILYDKPYKLPVFSKPADHNFDIANYSLYEGVYVTPELPVKMSVFQHEEQLFIEVTGQPAFPLVQVAENKFEKQNLKLEIEFPDNGKQMIFRQSGVELMLDKE